MTAVGRRAAAPDRDPAVRAPATRRQVNLALEVLVVVSLATGLASWAVGDRWSRSLTVVHGVAGLALLVLARPKVRGPVSTGLRRHRPTRWLSVTLGVLVLVTVGLGVLHATGLWFGVGPWSASWTHALAAMALVPLFAVHVTTRPVRPRLADLDRRALLRTAVVGGAAAALYGVQELAVGVVGGAGSRRRSTGSHEVASYDPDAMPRVIWFDDTQPGDTEPEGWSLVVGGTAVSVADLRARVQPVVATLDCTGGWWSEQTWDAVPLASLVEPGKGRSVRVSSATGYARRFAPDALDDVHLAVGYEGRPLAAGHGGPVRLVVPGRRGPWWVKWVTEVAADDRPAWFQLPLPPS